MRFRDKKHEQYEGDDEKPPEEVGLRDRLAHFTWYVCAQPLLGHELTVLQAMVRVHDVYRCSRRCPREHPK